jgi:hypothetical protein
VRSTNLLPVGRNVHHIHSCSHYVLEAGASLPQRGLDILQRLKRLCIGITNTHNVSSFIKCFRGVQRHVAMVLTTEIGDWRHFASPRHLMA